MCPKLAHVLGVALGIGVATRDAAAHDSLDPRLMVVTVRAEALEVRVTERAGPGKPSNRVRRLFDGNHNDTLEADELGRLRTYLQDAMLKRLQLRDASGDRIVWSIVRSTVSGAEGAVGDGAEVSIDVLLTIPVRADARGERVVVVSDELQGHPIPLIVSVDVGADVVPPPGSQWDASRNLLTGLRLLRHEPVTLRWRSK